MTATKARRHETKSTFVSSRLRGVPRHARSSPHLGGDRLWSVWRHEILQEPLRCEGRANLEAGVRVRLKVRQLRIDDGLRRDAAAVQIPGRLLRARRTAGQFVPLRWQKQDLCRFGNLIECRARAEIAVAEVSEQIDLALERKPAVHFRALSAARPLDR